MLFAPVALLPGIASITMGRLAWMDSRNVRVLAAAAAAAAAAGGGGGDGDDDDDDDDDGGGGGAGAGALGICHGLPPEDDLGRHSFAETFIAIAGAVPWGLPLAASGKDEGDICAFRRK